MASNSDMLPVLITVDEGGPVADRRIRRRATEARLRRLHAGTYTSVSCATRAEGHCRKSTVYPSNTRSVHLVSRKLLPGSLMSQHQKPMQGTTRQLSFVLEPVAFEDLEPSSPKASCMNAEILETTALLDLVPLIKKCDEHRDKVILRAIADRAAHLSDFLRKRT